MDFDVEEVGKNLPKILGNQLRVKSVDEATLLTVKLYAELNGV